MTMRMLIDARHPEETRVAVVNGNRIEEFDFESAERKQLKGNIYLAKVTRVEPSLQAAFIDYGGNRHGFLAFSEIHPDYYQIPREDREALLREEAEHAAQEEALRAQAEDDHDDDEDDHAGDDQAHGVETLEEPSEEEHDAEDEAAAGGDARPQTDRSRRRGGGDDIEAMRDRRMSLRRRYKIQDVIRRRQVLLVQVVKEERGNKGAALTTYLSLAGRYCVLMPNTSHGGGISRKISNAADRKRLKSIMAELKLPATMGCIVRTAGLQRTRAEIKRDFDYLARLWDEIRERTLHSAAPAEIHGDSDLIKRAIRDIYNRDIDEVIVEGEAGWREARSIMKLLMPTHARKVQLYTDTVPLYHRSGVEEQLLAMYQPVVQLKSGGYLVINPTEALVSIDINSGRSTREHGIEETALKTNMEAAQEIARQLRLRDMAGLVVIDFIDMESGGNTRRVEKAMKAALAGDRARIQVGRISAFGLMEMSRQRLRTGVLEASTRPCPHCEGSGMVRTTSSASLSALRMLEEEAARGRGSLLSLRVANEPAMFLLNRYRREIGEVEERYGVAVEVLPEPGIGTRMGVEVSGPPPVAPPRPVALLAPMPDDDDDELDAVDEAEEEYDAEDAEVREDETARGPSGRGEGRERDEGEGGPRRRRRRRRGGRRDEQAPAGDAPIAAGEDAEADEDAPVATETATAEDGAEGEGARRRRGRRGRRGGSRQRGDGAAGEAVNAAPDGEPGAEEPVEAVLAPVEAVAAPAEEAVSDTEAEAAPRPRRRPRAKPPAVATESGGEAAATAPPRRRRKPAGEDEAPVAEAALALVDGIEEAPVKPRRSRRKPAEPAAASDVAASAADSLEVPAEAEEELASAAPVETSEPATPRGGWWQRTFGA